MSSEPGRRRLLLDTHTLIWGGADDRQLSRKVRRLIEDEDNVEVVVSAASAWEIATKARLGRLAWPQGNETVRRYAVRQGFSLLPISFEHAEHAGAWPQEHGDPFDRILAAQSALEDIPLATNDQKIAAFDVKTVW